MQVELQRDTMTPQLTLMLARCRNPRETLEAIGLSVVSMAKRAHTDASLRPHVWPAMKSGKAGTLQKSTTMRRMWRVVSVSDDSVTVGNPMPYAAVHHTGGRKDYIIRGKGGKRLKFQIGGVTIYRKLVKMPKLPMRRVLPVTLDGRLTEHAERNVLGIARRKLLGGK